MLSDDLERIVVSVGDGGENIMGTGFLIRSDLVMTCKHVVRCSKDGTYFVGSLEGEMRQASLLEDDLPQLDACLLQLHRPLDSDASKPVEQFGTASGTRGHAVITFGFPEIGTQGLWAEGKVRGMLRDPGGSSLLQLDSVEISPGFSGAPVLDLDDGCIIGMVVQIADQNKYGRLGRTAFALPTEQLAGLELFAGIQEERPGSRQIQQRILRIIAQAGPVANKPSLSEEKLIAQAGLPVNELNEHLQVLLRENWVMLQRRSVGARVYKYYEITPEGWKVIQG